jgi:hypothetical protein
LVCLASAISGYVDALQRVNSDPHPHEDGADAMRATLRSLVNQQNLSNLEHLLILPPLIFRTLDTLLEQHPERRELINTTLPQIDYLPDRSITVTWSS